MGAECCVGPIRHLVMLHTHGWLYLSGQLTNMKKTLKKTFFFLSLASWYQCKYSSKPFPLEQPDSCLLGTLTNPITSVCKYDSKYPSCTSNNFQIANPVNLSLIYITSCCLSFKPVTVAFTGYNDTAHLHWCIHQRNQLWFITPTEYIHIYIQKRSCV